MKRYIRSSNGPSHTRRAGRDYTICTADAKGKKYPEADWYATPEEAIQVMNDSFPRNSKVMRYEPRSNTERILVEYHKNRY